MRRLFHAMVMLMRALQARLVPVARRRSSWTTSRNSLAKINCELACRIFFAATSFLALVFFAETVVAQPGFFINAVVRQLPSREGDSTYEFSVRAAPFISPGAIVETLMAPDGTSAGNSFPTTSQVLGENLTLAEANSKFSGKWTFVERRGDELLQYEFSLPELTPGIFPEAPEIVSPLQDEIVGTEFLLDWKSASGMEPSGVELNVSYGGGFSSRGYERIGNTPIRMMLGFEPGVAEGEVTMRVGESVSQNIDVRPVSPGADANFFLDFLSIKSFSAPVTVAVRIPEPSTSVTLAVAVSVLLASCRANKSLVSEEG